MIAKDYLGFIQRKYPKLIADIFTDCYDMMSVCHGSTVNIFVFLF